MEVYQDTMSMEVILITSNPMSNSQYVCSDGISSDGGVYCIVVASEYANLFVMYTHESYTHNRLRKLM